eukprot:TRINITY_DN10001_c0_g1_i1.p1 TRINITY_DN10001_c0_g1~~TRINITY_DN10001_c0_g1_i1.p1  ORF type:complete len:104 (+),score=16.00 TRINITY_DN10001_c0_g1_i1:166-477(+)
MNKDLSYQLELMTQERAQMADTVEKKDRRIKEILEERGIAMAEFKILLETVQEEKRGLQSARDEEQAVLTTNLRHQINHLSEENARLRTKYGATDETRRWWGL